MLKNTKKLDDLIKKGDFKEVAIVQLLIDSLGELLQVIISQLQIEEGREPTESQKAFLSGLKSNIVAFQNLKRQLEKMTDTDFLGEFAAQPLGGELFSTKSVKMEESEFIQMLVYERKEREKANKSNLDDGLGL